MKRLFLLLLMALFLSACAEDKRVCWKNEGGAPDCQVVKAIGLVGVLTGEKRPDVQYEVSIGSAFWCLFVPVGTLISGGWFLLQPVGPKIEPVYHDPVPAHPVQKHVPVTMVDPKGSGDPKEDDVTEPDVVADKVESIYDHRHPNEGSK